MREPKDGLAFIQIDMRFKGGYHRLFTFNDDLNEYDINLILDHLIDEMAGLEYDGPIRIVHQYNNGEKMVRPLVFNDINE